MTWEEIGKPGFAELGGGERFDFGVGQWVMKEM